MQKKSLLGRLSTSLHETETSSWNGRQLTRSNSGPDTPTKLSRLNTRKRRLSTGHTTELPNNQKCTKELAHSRSINHGERTTRNSKKVVETQPRSEGRCTRSLTMLNTSAELFSLVKPPPLKKRRSPRRISCDSSDSGDSGLCSREGNEPSTPGTPPSPPIFQPLCVDTDLISQACRSYNSNKSCSNLLTTGDPMSSDSNLQSNTNIGIQSIKCTAEEEQDSQSKPPSDSKKQKADSKQNVPRKRTRSEFKSKPADGGLRRSRRDCIIKRSRGDDNNEGEGTDRKRINRMRYLTRRLNPHLRSPERELPKKMTRRSLTTTLHRLHTSLTSSPMTPRKRRSRTENPSPSKQLDFTRAVSEDDSGVGSDDQSLKSDVESACNWRHCRAQVTEKELQDHITKTHVAHQTMSNRVYRCYWEGCKVYGKVAKSLLWLEGHTIKHLGPKPNYCIFPDCTDHFSTKELLQKHVESHIQMEAGGKTLVRTQSKLKSKRGYRSRILRRSEKCHVKPSDFFSSEIIDAIKWQEKMLRSNWSHIMSKDGESLIFAGEIMGMCTSSRDGSLHYLLHWSPEQFMLPDSWHPIDPNSTTLTKHVKISVLPTDVLYRPM